MLPSPAVLRLVKQLHACGIYHNDIEPRHLLKRDNGGLVIIDFDRAKELPNPQDVLLAQEKTEVQSLFGLRSHVW